ncbi:MAG: CoA protein activase [Actinobacteria bacterium]|nr:CoA protein activase [Actinomycetota bacterium]
MPVTWPHLGNLEIVLKDLITAAGQPYILPPKNTARTLQLGLRHSPEFACLPLKITIGNFIEALEAGADTLIMAGGIGPCRFGYYAQVQRAILNDLGYDFEMIVLEPPAMGWKLFVDTLKRIAPGKSLWEIAKAIKLAFRKGRAIDAVEREVLKYRAYERKKGATTKAYRAALNVLDEALFEKDAIDEAKEEALGLVYGVEKDVDRPVLKMGIVGEFYLLLEPFVNFDVEEYLGHSGVSIERSVYVSDWISPGNNNIIGGISEEEIKRAAAPYLNHFVGGEGQATVGHTVIYAGHGFDGVMQLFPFTCMPDTIAKSILPRVGRDFDIPILSLVIDEQTGKAGLITRLEAFLDLLWSRRMQREKRLLSV